MDDFEASRFHDELQDIARELRLTREVLWSLALIQAGAQADKAIALRHLAASRPPEPGKP